MPRVLCLALLCLVFAVPASLAQNTKGDRPVGNQRQVKETKSKSYKRKEKSSSRDLAGRRLRTRGSSSASRANAKHRQPPTTSRRPERVEDRSAPPRGRTFTRSPRESRSRAWKGDVSGYPMKRIRPSGRDAARSNVYPQKGPYVSSARKRPPKEKPPVYNRTIKGTRIVERKPRAKERAWTGGLQHEPIRNQSATGRTKNTFSQRGPYVAHYQRKAKKGTSSFSNRTQVAKVQRNSRPPRTGGSQPTFFPSSRSKSYVQRGRKNVYWGKYQKKERPVTTDLTGGPLRTRNYRSPAVGLVGRDSLKYFNRKPADDRGQKSPVSGYRTASRRGNKGWKGDVAGWPVRSPRAQKDRSPKQLTPTEPGIGASSMSEIFNNRFKGVKPEDRIPKRREYGYSGNLIGGRGFSQSGAGYRGNIRAGRGFSQGGAGYSGNLKRSKGFRGDYIGYSGNVKRSDLSSFSPSGFGYSGFMKRSDRTGFSKQGANYAGNQRRTKGFNTDYAGYSGSLRRSRGFRGDYIGYSVTMKRGATGFSKQCANYSGNLRRGRGFNTDYVGYSGTMKRGATGFSKQGANYSGNLRRGRGFNTDYVGYSGSIKRIGAYKQFNENGVEYSGFLRYGGAGFSNQGEGSLGKNKTALAKGFADDGAGFSGNKKAKRPLKGGGSVSGILWNNEESALARNPPATLRGADFSGRTKAKKPAKGGGTVSGILWNNQEKALTKSPPATVGATEGLHVKVKEGNYSRKKNASRDALPGVAPTRATVKASEYSRNMKMYWNYKHNPSSSADARKVIAPGKAEARIRDYQGNVKMRKFSVSGMHPDAKFAHSEEDNVKEERSFIANVKLFWEKMFNKSGTQPTSVKDKGKKLQYDKREKGLWAY